MTRESNNSVTSAMMCTILDKILTFCLQITWGRRVRALRTEIDRDGVHDKKGIRSRCLWPVKMAKNIRFSSFVFPFLGAVQNYHHLPL